ncbi:MAG TPA: biopolymer transporter ExbD [Verrucomicrobiae bacterium]|jgi:biopolymer transport protein ExbD|nr:biopolymer transporter ExbD [Verrucomicrobiae bacterium]
MRRFSQRNSLVTLSDINITPLLDLAFVLLIIFVITTPLLEKGLEIDLPKSSSPADKQQVKKEDVRVVEINAQGNYAVKGRILPLNQIVAQLAQDFHANPNLIVYVRADGNSYTKQLMALLDGCNHNGITRYSVRQQPEGQR